MGYNWEKYLELAKYLIDNSNKCDEEACLRTSLSRCYYGVRGVLCKHLRTLNAFPRENNIFIGYFKSSPDREIFQIGNKLYLLWYSRVNADYKDNFTLTKNKVSLNYALAEIIIVEFYKIKSSLVFDHTANTLSLNKP